MRFAKTLMFVAVLLMTATSLSAATAWMQVVHNAADPGAAVVDIYINNGPVPFLDDFAFRTASPFVKVPAGVNLNIGVAPGNSTGPGQIIADFDVVLCPNKKYVVMANGVLDPGAFAPNPDGRSIAFSLYPQDGIRHKCSRGKFAFIGFHGVTDAPSVDIRSRDQYGHSETLISGLTYGDFSCYRQLHAAPYELDVTLPGDPYAVVASFEADLSGLGCRTGVVFASGFLEAGVNRREDDFALCVALCDGTVLCLPKLDVTARLQVVHNSPDPGAAVVDIYLNQGPTPFLDDFAFRTATPYVDVPAGVPLSIGVAPGNSTGPGQIIASFDVVLMPNQKYIAMAAGVLDPGAFDPNPNDRDTGFWLFTRADMHEYAHCRMVNVIGFHGAPDAPAVDIFARCRRGAMRLADNLFFGDFSEYSRIKPGCYDIVVTLAEDNHAVVGTYKADLRGAVNMGVTVFASGFLNPSQGPAFGLFAVLPDGTVLELPMVPGCRMPGIASLGGAEPVTLFQNTPNPFVDNTSISFALPETRDVSIRVYNTMGQLVETALDERREAGRHSVNVSSVNMAPGVYYYEINAGNHREVKKMMVVK